MESSVQAETTRVTLRCLGVESTLTNFQFILPCVTVMFGHMTCFHGKHMLINMMLLVMNSGTKICFEVETSVCTADTKTYTLKHIIMWTGTAAWCWASMLKLVYQLQGAIPCDLSATMDTTDANSYMLKQCSTGYYGPVCSLCLKNGTDGVRYGRTGTSQCQACR